MFWSMSRDGTLDTKNAWHYKKICKAVFTSRPAIQKTFSKTHRRKHTTIQEANVVKYVKQHTFHKQCSQHISWGKTFLPFKTFLWNFCHTRVCRHGNKNHIWDPKTMHPKNIQKTEAKLFLTSHGRRKTSLICTVTSTLNRRQQENFRLKIAPHRGPGQNVT